MPEAAKAWARHNGFDGAAAAFLALPGEDGKLAGALFGLGANDDPLIYGKLATGAAGGRLEIRRRARQPDLALLGFLLGAYNFGKYLAPDKTAKDPRSPPPAVLTLRRHAHGGSRLARPRHGQHARQ